MIPLDDGGRWLVGAYTAAGIDAITASASNPTTPEIDGIAAAGTRMNHLISQPLCSNTRAAIMTGQSVHRDGNLYSNARSPEFPALTTVEINPYAYNLPRAMQSLGFDTAFFGKSHIGTSREAQGISESFVAALGFDHADAVALSNLRRATPLEPGSGHPNELTSAEDAALGHNLWVHSDHGGNARVETGYNSEVIFDTAIAYITQWLIDNPDPGDHLFVWIAPNAAHGPWCYDVQIGNSCDADDPNNPGHFKDDRPPGSTATSIQDVYRDMIEDLDTRIGELQDILDVTKDQMLILFDNGVPPEIPIPIECDESYGKKKFPHPCGTFVPAIWWGKDITVGVMDGLLKVEDLTPTLISLAGGTKYPSQDGISFSDCLTSSGGQTPATCTIENEFVAIARWDPVGGRGGGTIERAPQPGDLDTDWSLWHYSGWMGGFGTGLHLIYRIYWADFLPNFCETFYLAPPTGDIYLHSKDFGGNFALADTCDEGQDGGLIDSGDFQDAGGTPDPTPDQSDLDALARGHRGLAAMLKDQTPSFKGISF